MSAVPKKKLCWHCEGSIDRQVDNCPYCGVYIHTPEDEDTSLWNPPFNLKILSREKEAEASTPKSAEQSSALESEVKESEDIAPLNQIKKEILPILLLLMGSGLFLFGIVLLLFSQNGTLTLKWNGDNWFYYLLVAIPSLFFGWRCLSED